MLSRAPTFTQTSHDPLTAPRDNNQMGQLRFSRINFATFGMILACTSAQISYAGGEDAAQKYNDNPFVPFSCKATLKQQVTICGQARKNYDQYKDKDDEQSKNNTKQALDNFRSAFNRIRSCNDALKKVKDDMPWVRMAAHDTSKNINKNVNAMTALSKVDADKIAAINDQNKGLNITMLGQTQKCEALANAFNAGLEASSAVTISCNQAYPEDIEALKIPEQKQQWSDGERELNLKSMFNDREMRTAVASSVMAEKAKCQQLAETGSFNQDKNQNIDASNDNIKGKETSFDESLTENQRQKQRALGVGWMTSMTGKQNGLSGTGQQYVDKTFSSGGVGKCIKNICETITDMSRGAGILMGDPSAVNSAKGTGRKLADDFDDSLSYAPAKTLGSGADTAPSSAGVQPASAPMPAASGAARARAHNLLDDVTKKFGQ